MKVRGGTCLDDCVRGSLPEDVVEHALAAELADSIELLASQEEKWEKRKWICHRFGARKGRSRMPTRDDANIRPDAVRSAQKPSR